MEPINYQDHMSEAEMNASEDRYYEWLESIKVITEWETNIEID